MKQTPNRYQQSKPILHHAMQRILVSYNNRKKRGAYPLLNKTCEACVASNGQVVLFSDEAIQKGYGSISEMQETLGEYGDVEIDYIDKQTQSTMPQLSMLSKIVLRDLIQHGFHEHKIHDLIWYYAAKYDDADVEQELKDLQKWLEASEE